MAMTGSPFYEPILADGELKLPLGVTVGTQVHTLQGSFSFDAPVLSVLSARNRPFSSRTSVTAIGLNFGIADTSLLVAARAVECVTSGWTSATSALCDAAMWGRGTQLGGSVQVTIGVGGSAVASTAQQFNLCWFDR